MCSNGYQKAENEESSCLLHVSLKRRDWIIPLIEFVRPWLMLKMECMEKRICRINSKIWTFGTKERKKKNEFELGIEWSEELKDLKKKFVGAKTNLSYNISQLESKRCDKCSQISPNSTWSINSIFLEEPLQLEQWTLPSILQPVY